MVDELPNLGIAIRDYIRESTVLISVDYLGSVNNITVGWPGDKNNPINVPPFQDRIIINTGRGGQGDIGLGLQQERVDIDCYGKTEAKANQIWRALDFYFFPVNTRRKTSFTRKGCQVNKIQREGGALKLVDESSANWPYTHATYIFTYNSLIRV